MNALLCGNYLEHFSEVSHVGCSDECSSKCSHLLCTESCKDLVSGTCDLNTFLNDDPENSLKCHVFYLLLKLFLYGLVYFLLGFRHLIFLLLLVAFVGFA